MITPEADQRSPARRARDEQIAADPLIGLARVAARRRSRRRSRPTLADLAVVPWPSPVSSRMG